MAKVPVTPEIQGSKEDSFSIPYQTKIQAANATGSGTMNDLTFNNLEIGKTYRVTGQFSHQSVSSAAASAVSATHDGAVVGASQHDSNSNSNNGRMRSGISGVFTATTTTLTFEATASANDVIEGDGTRFQTYVQLEELPNHVTTTQWT